MKVLVDGGIVLKDAAPTPSELLLAVADVIKAQKVKKPDREKIAKTMYYQHVTSGFKWENEGQWFKDKYLSYADEIIALFNMGGPA